MTIDRTIMTWGRTADLLVQPLERAGDVIPAVIGTEIDFQGFPNAKPIAGLESQPRGEMPSLDLRTRDVALYIQPVWTPSGPRSAFFDVASGLDQVEFFAGYSVTYGSGGVELHQARRLPALGDVIHVAADQARVCVAAIAPGDQAWGDELLGRPLRVRGGAVPGVPVPTTLPGLARQIAGLQVEGEILPPFCHAIEVAWDPSGAQDPLQIVWLAPGPFGINVLSPAVVAAGQTRRLPVPLIATGFQYSSTSDGYLSTLNFTRG